MGWFIEKPTPFIPEFLNRMMQLDYPKKRIDLLIHNSVGTLSAKYILYLYLAYMSLDSQDRKKQLKTRLCDSSQKFPRF